MSEQISARGIEFEQNYNRSEHHETATGITRDVLALADTAMRFSYVERVPRYTPETRENDAEHSFMLGLVAQEIAVSYFPELDSGLVARFALVHDLLELHTGDVATFAISDGALQDKCSNEKSALEAVCSELPPKTALLLRVYEEQELPEARFVRFIDKLLPVAVDILGPGSQVMHEDYDTLTRQDLVLAENSLRSRFEKMFPEFHFTPIHIARNGLARKFEEVFQPASSVQEVLF